MNADERISDLIATLTVEVDRFLEGALSADELSGTAKAGVASLLAFGADAEWSEEVRTSRNDIEYAVATWQASGRADMNADEERIVLDAAAKLRAQLVAYPRQ